MHSATRSSGATAESRCWSAISPVSAVEIAGRRGREIAPSVCTGRKKERCLPISLLNRWTALFPHVVTFAPGRALWRALALDEITITSGSAESGPGLILPALLKKSDGAPRVACAVRIRALCAGPHNAATPASRMRMILQKAALCAPAY